MPNFETFFRGEIPTHLERRPSITDSFLIEINTEDAAPEFDMKELFEEARPALPR
jgi:hypothetical protein